MQASEVYDTIEHGTTISRRLYWTPKESFLTLLDSHCPKLVLCRHRPFVFYLSSILRAPSLCRPNIAWVCPPNKGESPGGRQNGLACRQNASDLNGKLGFRAVVRKDISIQLTETVP